MKPNEFFCYHAGKLAIDPARPWQICSRMGVLLGQVATVEQAKKAVEALKEDKENGTLPTNLSNWERKSLLE